MKKKLNLKALQVHSFVTEPTDYANLKGGGALISNTTICDVNCQYCDTDDGGDDTGGASDGDVCTVIGFA